MYQELFLGTNPYINVTDNYYVIDWKWGNFMYEPYNVLLDLKWEDVIDRQQIWDINYPTLSFNQTITWGDITREKIDKYLNIEPAPLDSIYGVSTDYLRPWFIGKFSTLPDVPDDIAIEYHKEVARQDSLQRVYIERLSQIIEESAIEKLGYFYHVKK